MTRQPTQTALENRFAAESRSFATERCVIEDGYGGTVFDGYSAIITTDGYEGDPILVPFYRLESYDGVVAKMENEMDSVDSLPYEEQQYYMDKYNYFKGLRDALKGE